MSTKPLPKDPPRPFIPCPLPPTADPPPGSAARFRSDLDDRRVFECESAKRITSGTCPPAGTLPLAVTTALAACSMDEKRISAPAVVVPDACSRRHSMIVPKILKNARSSTSVHSGGKPLT